MHNVIITTTLSTYKRIPREERRGRKVYVSSMYVARYILLVVVKKQAITIEWATFECLRTLNYSIGSVPQLTNGISLHTVSLHDACDPLAEEEGTLHIQYAHCSLS